MDRTELHESILKNAKLTFARSGGKGGQNVNKVNTKVHLSILLSELGGITEEERLRLKIKLSSILNNEECLYIDVDEERFQERNRAIALDRIENRIVNALKLQKKRKKTKPTKTSVEKRLKLKKSKSEIKRNRGKITL